MGKFVLINFHCVIPLPHELGIGVSEQANERSMQCGASKWVGSASNRASGCANGPALYASISCHFYPECSGGGLAAELTRSFRRKNLLPHELKEVSRQASEWPQRSAQAKQTVQSKQMSEQCERSSKRMSKWPSTLRVNFMPFLP